MVDKLSDLYDIGTFAQIVEVQDLGKFSFMTSIENLNYFHNNIQKKYRQHIFLTIQIASWKLVLLIY